MSYSYGTLYLLGTRRQGDGDTQTNRMDLKETVIETNHFGWTRISGFNLRGAGTSEGSNGVGIRRRGQFICAIRRTSADVGCDEVRHHYGQVWSDRGVSDSKNSRPRVLNHELSTHNLLTYQGPIRSISPLQDCLDALTENL